jgi:hypothetical protein
MKRAVGCRSRERLSAISEPYNGVSYRNPGRSVNDLSGYLWGRWIFINETALVQERYRCQQCCQFDFHWSFLFVSTTIEPILPERRLPSNFEITSPGRMAYERHTVEISQMNFKLGHYQKREDQRQRIPGISAASSTGTPWAAFALVTGRAIQIGCH